MSLEQELYLISAVISVVTVGFGLFLTWGANKYNGESF